jgi:hypothetical protein
MEASNNYSNEAVPPQIDTVGCRFGDFAVDGLVRSSWSQNTFDRALKELSIGIKQVDNWPILKAPGIFQSRAVCSLSHHDLIKSKLSL